MKKIFIILLSLILVSCSNGKQSEETKVNADTDKKVEESKDTKEDTKKEEKVEEKKEEKKEENSEKKLDSSNLPYKSVVAGSASVAEYLAELEIPVVGVTEQDNIPEVYKDAKRIGLPRKLNLEIIGSLNPDLFVGDKTLEEINTKDLGNFEVEKLYLDNSSYDNVFESIQKLGETFGRSEKAKEIVDSIKSKETEVLSGAEALKDKKVVVLFGTGESYMLATENSFIGSLLEKLGVNNIAKGMAKGPRPYVKFSLENVVAENPDYILTLSHGNKEQASKMFEDEMQKDLWKTTNAVTNGKLYSLNDKDFPVTGNIHIMETLKNLKELLLGN